MVRKDDAENNIGVRLVSDIIYLTQRASAQTSEIAVRTIERQTTRFLSKHPGEVKNASAYTLAVNKLCECIMSLKSVTLGTGSEIKAKREALDILLALSNEIECRQHIAEDIDQTDTTVLMPDAVRIAV